MKLAIGCDHAGFELKEQVLAYLRESYEIKDFGTYNNDRVDYPDFAHQVANAIENKEYQFGILICGSANGISMAANKHQNIRAAVCWNEEITDLARKHNDANIISLPARFINEELAKKCIDIFLSTSFEAGRHENRVNKISC